MSKQQIGVVGMAVMGRNLALNIESHWLYRLYLQPFPRKTEEVVAGREETGSLLHGERVRRVSETPRRILLMVKGVLAPMPPLIL